MTVDIAQRAEAMAKLGQVGGALDLLEAEIGRGDADAAFALAVWRLSGTIVPRDLRRAQTLFDRAACLGDSRAETISIALLAHGACGERDWQQAVARLARSADGGDADAVDERDLLAAMALTPQGDPLVVPAWQALHGLADIRLYRSALTPSECAFLIRRSTTRFRSSAVVDPSTGRRIQHPIRTSDAASFPLIAESPAIHALNRRFAAMSGTQPAQGEPLQVLRYSVGQQYRLHMDALPNNTDNQRAWTLLAYLNDDFDGGETHFPDLGLSIRARKGDALLFANLNPDGTSDDSMRHAGLPVRRGTKLVASRWIRVQPLNLAASEHHGGR